MVRKVFNYFLTAVLNYLHLPLLFYFCPLKMNGYDAAKIYLGARKKV